MMSEHLRNTFSSQRAPRVALKKNSKNVKRSNVSKFLWLKKKKGNILSFSVQNSTQLRHIKRNDKRFPEMISI